MRNASLSHFFSICIFLLVKWLWTVKVLNLYLAESTIFFFLHATSILGIRCHYHHHIFEGVSEPGFLSKPAHVSSPEIFTAGPVKREQFSKPRVVRCSERIANNNADTIRPGWSDSNHGVPKGHVTRETEIVARRSHSSSRLSGNENAHLFGLLIAMSGSEHVNVDNFW